MKLSKDFDLEEFVPRYIYKSLGGKCIRLIDKRIVTIQQTLRNQFGKVIINSWNNGGMSQWRGWRPYWCGVGSEFSQHLFGRATDSTFLEASAEEVREEIRQNQEYWYEIGIRRVEEDSTHLHIDIGESGLIGEIYFFEKPIKKEE